MSIEPRSTLEGAVSEGLERGWRGWVGALMRKYVYLPPEVEREEYFLSPYWAVHHMSSEEVREWMGELTETKTDQRPETAEARPDLE